jgi:hypothetical protein
VVLPREIHRTPKELDKTTMLTSIKDMMPSGWKKKKKA